MTRKPGRPAMEPKDRKTIEVKVRFDRHQHGRLREEARAVGLSVSGLVRQACIVWMKRNGNSWRV